MPQNVLEHVEVDYSVSIEEMIYIIIDMHAKEEYEPTLVPEHVTSSIDDLVELGELTPYTCPHCGGILARIMEGGLARYRCYTGHAFTARALELEQIKAMEESLWITIRILEERKNLLNSLSSGKSISQDIGMHIDRLKSLMMELGKNAEIN